MGSRILYSTGDLIEYTREMKSYPQLPDEMRLRAIVRGVEVKESEFGDKRVSIRLLEGRHAPFGEPVRQPTADGEAEMTVWESGGWLRERQLVALDMDYVVEDLEPTLIRSGNPERSLDPFIIDDGVVEGPAEEDDDV